MRTGLIFLVCLQLSLSSLCQNQASLNTKTSLQELVTIGEVFQALEEATGIFLSYNPLALDLQQNLSLPRDITWNKALDLITDQTGYQFQFEAEAGKLLITPSDHIVITGIVKDANSYESMPSVAVYSRGNEGVYTNEEGYFRLKLKRRDTSLYVSYLGWQTVAIPLSKKYRQDHEILLVYDNKLPELVIKDTVKNPLVHVIPWRAKEDHVGKMRGIGGSPDLFSELRTSIGVSVGYEAQNGFMVRGGGPDQNLVLVDGVPIFETTHLGGIASVFSDQIIKSADLYTGAIPSRFGGRLSSVLDVRLKDGNRKEYNRSVDVGLERISGLLEGPLGKNTLSFVLHYEKIEFQGFQYGG